jgi:hypothetical protein
MLSLGHIGSDNRRFLNWPTDMVAMSMDMAAAVQ